MPVYLQHKPTGDWYIFSDILGKRDDMLRVDADSLEEAKGMGKTPPLLIEPEEIVKVSKVTAVKDKPANKGKSAYKATDSLFDVD